MWLHIPKTITSRFFPASECSIYPSESLCQQLGASVIVNGKARQPRYWRLAWQKANWTKRLSTPTCDRSRSNRIVAEWLASLVASPAKTSALPADRQESTATAAGSFLRSSDLFASWSPSSGCFLKTSLQSSLFQQEQPYSENLPRSGSMRNGRLYERQTVVHRTDAIERLSLRIETDWRTPNTRDHHAGGPRLHHAQRQVGLENEAKFWSTPNSRDVKNPGDQSGKRSIRKTQQGWSIDLNDQAAWWSASSADTSSMRTADDTVAQTVKESAWPTPASRDHKGTNSTSHMDRSSGAKHLDQLPNFVEHCFHQARPTPQHGPQFSQSDRTSRRRLNPAFVEWLMGLPIGYTACGRSEMGSFRYRQQLRSAYLRIVREFSGRTSDDTPAGE